jgi:pimeloyl-ACP methyl ester carboxylesterase
LVTGEFDSSVPPSAARSHAALFRNAELKIIVGAGHLSPLEQPKMFAGMVKDFMRKVEDKGA